MFYGGKELQLQLVNYSLLFFKKKTLLSSFFLNPKPLQFVCQFFIPPLNADDKISKRMIIGRL